MRPKTITLAIVCAVAMAGLFGPDRQPSSGQTTGREAPCGCYTCQWQLVPTLYVYFPDAPKNCYGIIGFSACRVEMAKMPDKGKAYCQKIKKELGITSFRGRDCPEWAAACGEDEKKPPDTKCEPPPPETNNPPWLNQDLPCRDRQRATMSWSQTRASSMDVSFTVSMCGEIIRFINRGGGSPERNPPGIRSFEVCCDSWRKAANTKSPCDARRDIDCDGTPNESDQTPEYSGRSRSTDDFVSNSPLSNLPFWKKLDNGMPFQSGCKDCKWELVHVDYTCKEEFDPMRSARESRNVFDARYDYQATWKCPANGQTQVTKDYETMYGLRCPTPPNRSWP